MPITSTDLHFYASERLTQDDDGGGRITAIEVVDGVENNVFPDIASGDRIAGRVWLCKVFPAVRTSDRDRYLASRAFISEPPSDPLVSVACFSTEGWSDERATAQNYVESYVVVGPRSEMVLYGDHVAGQRQMFAYQRVGAAIPEIGEVFVLSEEVDEVVTAEQYVRMTKVEFETVTWTDSDGSYQKVLMALTLSDALESRFEGGEQRRYTNYLPPTIIRVTTSVDAANFKSISSIEPAVPNALTVTADSIFVRAVPATQSEVAMLDIQGGGAKLMYIANGTRRVIVPQIANTWKLPINLANAQLNYTALLNPLPGPASLSISYRAQGKWYTVSDYEKGGDGTLSGAGAGTVNYLTGSVAVTVQAIPDVNSCVLFSWATPAHYDSLIGGHAYISPPCITHTMLHPPIKRGDLTVSWETGGIIKTASDTGGGGFTGDVASGSTVDYDTGAFSIVPSAWPDQGSPIVVGYLGYKSIRGTETVTPSTRTYVLNFPIGSSELKPNTLYLTFTVWLKRSCADYSVLCWVRDNGIGGLVGDPIVDESSSVVYETGVVTLVLKATKVTYGLVWITVDNPYPPPTVREVPLWTDEPWDVTAGQLIAIDYCGVVITGAETEYEEQPTLSSLTLDLTPITRFTIVPNSLKFTWGGRTYFDQDGSMYYATNTQAGTIDYTTRIMAITDWPSGVTGIAIGAGLAQKGLVLMTYATFRAPGSPLRPQSVQLAALATTGVLLTATTDPNGLLSGDLILGQVDYDFGMIEARFGESRLASGLTNAEKAEPWYDVENVVNGYIWKPQPVIASTVRFNCVIYSSLPLGADLLGLSPVRLPMDGRVPFIRLGDSAAIHHTGTITLPNPLQSNYECDCGRTRLARVWLTDALGVKVAGSKYAADLDLGIVTIANNLNLDGYTEPLTVHHLIADEALVTGVDISGTVQLGRPLTHTFPSGSYISTEWRIGDLGARVTTPFAQQAWTSVWADTIIGNPITPQFSNSIYPIVVTNDGSAQERWRIQFTGTTTVHVIGETLGQIATSQSITSPIAPENPITGQPYFTIPHEGWGSGWVSGHVLRFNTFAADYPLWLLRCVQQGPASGNEDRLSLEFLGDVDA